MKPPTPLPRRGLLAGGAALLAGCVAAPLARPSGVGAPSATPTVSATPIPAAARPFRFAVASDGHWGEKGTDYRKHFARLVRWVNALHAQTPLSCLVFNGDIAHDVDGLPGARDALASLEVPLEVVPGNHDEASAAQWQEVWGVPVNRIARYGDVAFVLATTSDQAGEYLCPDRAWLADALTEVADARAAFLVLHIPQKSLSRWGVACEGLLDLEVASPNLRAVLHGHDHDLNTVATRGGLPFVFDGHVGGHWGTREHTFRVLELAGDGALSTTLVSDGRAGKPERLPGRTPS